MHNFPLSFNINLKCMHISLMHWSYTVMKMLVYMSRIEFVQNVQIILIFLLDLIFNSLQLDMHMIKLAIIYVDQMKTSSIKLPVGVEGLIALLTSQCFQIPADAQNVSYLRLYSRKICSKSFA